jgi:hypothetical protein
VPTTKVRLRVGDIGLSCFENKQTG